MKILFLVCLSLSLYASTPQTQVCQKCHPIIVSEFESSMHKKSTIYEDKIHKAIWDKHPAKKSNNYKCAKCHTPNSQTQGASHQGITCISCHTIKDVKEHQKANQNIYETKPKTFYSAQKGREKEKVTYKVVDTWWGGKTTVGSAYHDIDYTNKKFYNGEMCMGCHSHKKNSKQFMVCSTEKADDRDTKENCITCHMPKILGTATTVRLSEKHAFHGFSGSILKPKMLSKYVKLHLNKTVDGFEISIKNQAPHNLLTHPLRVVQLRVTLTREKKQTKLKTHSFVKIIGHNGKPSMPWLATQVVKDTMIKGKENRVIAFNKQLKKGDSVEVSIGYYLVNPKALKKLNLDNESDLKKFIVLKTQYFDVK